MSKVLLVLGIVLLVFGVLFGLQGFGVIGGSAMSGKTMWKILGPVIAIVGIILMARGSRSGARRSRV